MTQALTDYANEVRNGQFLSQENFYEIKEEELEKLLGDEKWKYELDKDYYHNTNHSVTPITNNSTVVKR